MDTDIKKNPQKPFTIWDTKDDGRSQIKDLVKNFIKWQIKKTRK